VNTEITEYTSRPPIHGWVLYDGECSLCISLARRFDSLLLSRGFRLTPLQTPWVRERLSFQAGAPFTEMGLLTTDGRAFGGADAIVEIARRIWWGRPFFVLAQIPGARPVLRAGYRRIADRRHCLGGACRMPRRAPLIDWLPLPLLAGLGLMCRNHVPDWIFMWLLAFALFFGCKWLTWRKVSIQSSHHTPLLSLGYLFAWPGMDARSFLGGTAPGPVIAAQSRPAPITPSPADWSIAVGKTLFGILLTWKIAPLALKANPLLGGWIGMIGLVFLLHFGLFHLLALAWRRIGVNAQPIMHAPAVATSVSEFWGKRWNAAYHLLVQEFVFRPLRRRCGAVGAALAAFLISGLIHELVISFPARGGYGWPTAYFLVQGWAVLFERSALGRRLGLGHGRRGWLFMLACTAGPTVWLFHRPFVQNIILPMLQAIGAI
jgi:predicted DCC family thiol-disulfide oxidoreductase YuxK